MTSIPTPASLDLLRRNPWRTDVLEWKAKDPGEPLFNEVVDTQRVHPETLYGKPLQRMVVTIDHGHRRPR